MALANDPDFAADPAQPNSPAQAADPAQPSRGNAGHYATPPVLNPTFWTLAST